MAVYKDMKRLRKAIIPAAGLGTRFLPATKTIPKEMLPIIDRPVLLYIVEEAVRAGIEDIVLIAGRGKTAIEDFFDVSYELQDKLEKEGKHDWLETLLKIQSMANIISVRQKQALGLGHAVMCGYPVVGEEPFAVLLGDEVMINKPSEATVTETVAKLFNETQSSSVAIMQVPKSDQSKYGIVDGKPMKSSSDQTVLKLDRIIEKPKPGETESLWALPGRYVFTAEIFKYLKNLKPGRNGELQLTDAMIPLCASQSMYATTFQSQRFDTGDKLGFLKANIELALERPELGPQLREYLNTLRT